VTEKEIENIRNELFEDGYRRNQKWTEKLTAGIKPAESEASCPAVIRARLEEQRQLLRDILVEGNNLLPGREAATDLDELKKALSIYAAKRNSKNPGDGFSEYAFDIVRRIQLYRDQEALVEIEMEQREAEKQQVRGNENKAEDHYFMKFCEKNYPATYKAMQSGLGKGCILFDGTRFNFLLPIGKVCYFFSNTGCTEVKEIIKYILINGKEASRNSLRNTKNYKLEQWTELRALLEL
jgi:hypothetical protein